MSILRFLAPLDDEVRLVEDSPTVTGPRSARYLPDTNVIDLSRVPLHGGLAILGEPGMGKTTALDDLTDVWLSSGKAHTETRIDLELVQDMPTFDLFVARPIRAQIALWENEPQHDAAKPAQMVDGTDTSPLAKIIVGASSASLDTALSGLPLQSKSGRAELQPAARVLVVLDNLDRCALSSKVLSTLLTDLLEGANLERLCLVIGCRATDWRGGFEAGLRALLPGFSVMQLLPLRPVDVGDLATAHGVEDPTSFLSAVDAAGAMALASIPMSALLLITLYQDGVALPSDPAELFELALTKLAAEPDGEWATAQRRRGLPVLLAHQRLAVAGRVAAWTLLCGFAAVQCEEARAKASADLSIGELVGGVEPADGGDVPVDGKALTDTLACALFTGRTDDRRVFRHQTMAAFLAARYLVRHKVAEEQLRSVLLSSPDVGEKVYPQLREIAAWLAALDPAAHRWLVVADAETMASYPYAVESMQLRPLLVDCLLGLADADALRNRSLSALRIDRLGHPGLVGQLRPALVDGSDERRRAAIDIARAVGAVELLGDLTDLALDPRHGDSVRVRAVMAASDLDREHAGRALRPLLTDAEEDLTEELRGALLDALWPQALNAEELVAAMTEDKTPLVTDLYTLFRFHLPDRLSDGDLPAILAWAAGQPVAGQCHTTNPGGVRRADDLISRLIARAWQVRDRSTLLPALAAVIHQQLRSETHFQLPKPLSCSTPAQDADRRSLLILLVGWVQSVNELNRLAFNQFTRSLHLLRLSDLGWLLEQEQAADDATAPRWHRLIRIIFSPTDSTHRDLARSREGTRAWIQVLSPYFDTTDDAALSSEAPLRADVSDQPGPDESPSDAEHVLSHQGHLDALTGLLEQAEQQDQDAFWQLCWRMQVDPDTGTGHTWWTDDLAARPGYLALAGTDSTAPARIVAAADSYLRNHHPHTEEWIDSVNILNHPAQAGYLAFALLDRQAPERLDALPPAVWETWAPALLWFDASAADAGDKDRKLHLLTFLGRHAPEAVAGPTVRMMRAATTAGTVAREVRFTSACWSPHLADALYAQLPALHTGPELTNFDTTLRLLLGKKHPGALTYALEAVDAVMHGGDLLLARHTALALLHENPNAGWPRVFAALRDQPAWGRDLVVDLATDYPPADLLTKLDEPQLGALYRWLLVQFPPEADVWPTEFHFMTREREAIFWRERVINHLIARGTNSSVQELSALVTANPERLWMRQSLASAQEQYRNTGWTAIRLNDLRPLIEDSRRRYLLDSADLLRYVVAELGELQKRMQGETPEARFLWDDPHDPDDKSGWWPKREADLSNYIAKYLRMRLGDRGIFTNREVEIGRTDAQGLGNRVDLLCQAWTRGQPRNADQECRIVIEVKGCWNPHLLTELHDQLAADYMPKADTRHGIYLVGWFPKDQWSTDDRLRSSAPDGTRDDLQADLDQQAALELNRTGMHIRAIILDLHRPQQTVRHGATSALHTTAAERPSSSGHGTSAPA